MQNLKMKVITPSPSPTLSVFKRPTLRLSVWLVMSDGRTDSQTLVTVTQTIIPWTSRFPYEYYESKMKRKNARGTVT